MNQSIDLDFIQAPAFSLSRFVGLRLAALVIGLAAAVITWQLHQSKQAELTALEAGTAQLKQVKKIQPTVKQTNVAIAPEKLRELQETVNVLAMPWDSLFEAIENTQNKDVTLLSLEPNPKKQQLMLTGEAKNLQIALQYVAQLQKQSVLSQVFLQKHSVDESNVSKPVRFTVQTQWEVAR
jgi:Fimbrial assembly protein (PilN)